MPRGEDYTAAEVVRLALVAHLYTELTKEFDRPHGSINRKVMELLEDTQRSNNLSETVRKWWPNQSYNQLRSASDYVRDLWMKGERADAERFATRLLDL
jgi:hypothetical protein